MAENNQTRSRAARRRQKKAKKKPIFKYILVTIGTLILLAGIGVGALFAYYIATAPELDYAKLSDPFSSKVYDKDGEIIADLGDTKRTKIEYDDLPQVLIDAVIATEDVRFFEHPGIDIRRIGAAIIANIKRGFGAEGASTITQQVVEKSFLSSEKKLKLKVQEQWLALKLERDFTKEQILEMYLNKIYYGAGAYGVAKAAEVYFGKTDLHDLTLIEAAILAGLPQRPSAYDPYKNPDLMKKRVDTVLDLMVRHKKITEAEAEEAKQIDITTLLVGKKPMAPPYEAFIQKVEQEVRDKIEGADIYTDGLKIYTTLDRKAQEYVEFLLTDSEENPIEYPDDELQAGMVVVDTKTGEIRAIGGSRNREQIDGYNYAFNENGRQPGSTFKPIIAYGPAIEYKKYSTYHQINDDKPYEIKGTNSTIRNWNRQYQGWMSMRYALSRSLNVPTVKLLEEAGFENAKEFAEGLGIKFHNDQILIGDAIGGTSTNTTPLQLAGAYSAFGNEGIYNEPHAVTKVEFPDGRVMDLKPEPKVAMSDYTAYMVTDMLKTAVTDPGATGTRANIPGLPMAGKTGTTNLEGKSGANNAWFAGYTTNYTIAVWSGYDDHQRIIENTRISQMLFKHTMEELSKDIVTEDFKKPDSVIEVAVEDGSNPPKLPSPHTPSSKIVTELFVKGTEPKEVSETFDKLDPVSGLKADYLAETNSIHVEWGYDEELDVAFEVSVSVNGGPMQLLTVTQDYAIDIEQIESDSEYVIQVVVVDQENSDLRSDPSQVTVRVIIEEEEEEDENGGTITAVEGLSGYYDAGRNLIDVSWSYHGPPAAFEVEVRGQTQIVESHGIEITGIAPGDYTITVTPIGKQGAHAGVRGEPRRINVTVPADQETGGSDTNEPQDEEESEEES